MLHLVYTVLLLSASFNTATPVVAALPLGLTATGTSAGSIAASTMSMLAGMNGGATAAGGFVETLKSVVIPVVADGFTASGISAVSGKASMMSAFAGMNRGATVADGVVSTLKSAVIPVVADGFTASGISAVSGKASMMSAFAGMNRGATVADGVVSTLKSAVVAAGPLWLNAAGISGGSSVASMMSAFAGTDGGATVAGGVTTLHCVDWSTVAWVAGGAVIVVVAAPLAIGALGFTPAGISAGSGAASMMSTFAVMNGGATAAGGVVATMQSIGVIGLTAKGIIVLAIAGGGFGYAAKSYFLDENCVIQFNGRGFV